MSLASYGMRTRWFLDNSESLEVNSHWFYSKTVIRDRDYGHILLEESWNIYEVEYEN